MTPNVVATSECGYAFHLTFCHFANKNRYAQIISGYVLVIARPELQTGRFNVYVFASIKIVDLVHITPYVPLIIENIFRVLSNEKLKGSGYVLLGKGRGKN